MIIDKVTGSLLSGCMRDKKSAMGSRDYWRYGDGEHPITADVENGGIRAKLVTVNVIVFDEFENFLNQDTSPRTT